MIGKDGIKIADFGCAKLMQEVGGSSKSAFSGTPAYMSSEVALGCTIIEMETGCSPWQEMEDPVSALYRLDIPVRYRNIQAGCLIMLKNCSQSV